MISRVLAEFCHTTPPPRRTRPVASLPLGAVIVLAGLLVLASVLSDAHPAFAQARLDCPLPAGVTPPTPLSVTAQQVEDDSTLLKDFLLAARGELSQEGATPEEASHTGCLMRQEGSSWRSGSTYLVTLTPDGRILLHTKDMSLSGRLLAPAIYGTILHALGIDPAALTDPAAAQAAFTAVADGEGGPFNVPDVPGASGYAVVHFDNFMIPLAMLAGFDIGESHLVPISDETIDYGDPATTASDVVDRETLKAFVMEAGNYAVSLLESNDLAALSKARIAARDPNGPWRHGSVYFYILDTLGNVILFHGAFPDRYELRPLVATVRDVVTGELILPQVIEAAKSNPGGGFVEYYFDDPTDDTDSADIPKVGYARVFSGQIQRPDGTLSPYDLIIGSGFYQSPGGAGTLEGRLENPGSPHAFQSGIGALWGWVCEAEMVEIEIGTAQGDFAWHMAEYGMERLDTLDTCGDTDNGFVLLFNWNQLGEGEHMVTALVDGAELGRARVTVTTLGEGAQQEFLRGVAGECVVEDFPAMGEAVTLEWQQNSQNFVITNVE